MPIDPRRHASVGVDPSIPAGPLHHLLEQLWAPLLADGQVRITTGAPRDAAWVTAEEYVVLPGLQRASMLLPAGPRRALRGALLNYRGLRRRLPDAQRTVLGGLAASPLPLPFPRVRLEVAARAGSDTSTALPLAVAARALGRRTAYASIGIRTGANRKATLQLVDEAGAPLGYAKVAWDRVSADDVEREAAALAEPDGGPGSRARRPALAARGDYHGWPFLVSAPLPLDSRGVRAQVPLPTPAEIFSLVPIVRHGAASGTQQVAALRSRLKAHGTMSETRALAENATALLDELDRLASTRSEDLPVTSRNHGDFTPWNVARDRAGVLWAWDWESSEPDAVAGLDAVHWHMAVQNEAGRTMDGAVLRDAVVRAAPVLVAAGVPRTARGQVAAVHAVTLVERACDLALRSGTWEKDWISRESAADLLTAARHLLEPA